MTAASEAKWSEEDQRTQSRLVDELEAEVEATDTRGCCSCRACWGRAVKKAILAERERCAAVCRGMQAKLRLEASDQLQLEHTVEECAAAILAGPAESKRHA